MINKLVIKKEYPIYKQTKVKQWIVVEREETELHFLNKALRKDFTELLFELRSEGSEIVCNI